MEIPPLSPSSSLYSASFSPPSSSASDSRRKLKRSFYIPMPAFSSRAQMSDPAFAALSEEDRRRGAVSIDGGKGYVSVLGCEHQWDELRLLQSRQMIVAPYCLLTQ